MKPIASAATAPATIAAGTHQPEPAVQRDHPRARPRPPRGRPPRNHSGPNGSGRARRQEQPRAAWCRPRCAGPVGAPTSSRCIATTITTAQTAKNTSDGRSSRDRAAADERPGRLAAPARRRRTPRGSRTHRRRRRSASPGGPRCASHRPGRHADRARRAQSRRPPTRRSPIEPVARTRRRRCSPPAGSRRPGPGWPGVASTIASSERSAIRGRPTRRQQPRQAF